MPAEITSLGVNGSAESTLLKAIDWATGPENVGQPYEVVVRSGESFRRKFPQLVAAKRRKAQTNGEFEEHHFAEMVEAAKRRIST